MNEKEKHIVEDQSIIELSNYLLGVPEIISQLVRDTGRRRILMESRIQSIYPECVNHKFVYDYITHELTIYDEER